MSVYTIEWFLAQFWTNDHLHNAMCETYVVLLMCQLRVKVIWKVKYQTLSRMLDLQDELYLAIVFFLYILTYFELQMSEWLHSPPINVHAVWCNNSLMLSVYFYEAYIAIPFVNFKVNRTSLSITCQNLFKCLSKIWSEVRIYAVL